MLQVSDAVDPPLDDTHSKGALATVCRLPSGMATQRPAGRDRWQHTTDMRDPRMKKVRTGGPGALDQAPLEQHLIGGPDLVPI